MHPIESMMTTAITDHRWWMLTPSSAIRFRRYGNVIADFKALWICSGGGVDGKEADP
ncbi:MAG: hypothetical protein ACLUVV_04800 [Christensenellales bacterium]